LGGKRKKKEREKVEEGKSFVSRKNGRSETPEEREDQDKKEKLLKPLMPLIGEREEEK